VSRLPRSLAEAPATFAWLAVLLWTTRRQRAAGRRRAHLLRARSTNLHHLKRRPVRVLVASLFWLDDHRWWPYVMPYVTVLAPAERRLGTWRWLLVGASAHVTGTYVGQGYLRRSIRRANASPGLANARDVGVSYFFLGVAGTVSAYVPAPYRLPSQTVTLGALVANAVARPTFTEVGHLSAYIVGLLMTPLASGTQERPYPGIHSHAHHRHESHRRRRR
jgi:hypothetical protein